MCMSFLVLSIWHSGWPWTPGFKQSSCPSLPRGLSYRLWLLYLADVSRGWFVGVKPGPDSDGSDSWDAEVNRLSLLYHWHCGQRLRKPSHPGCINSYQIRHPTLSLFLDGPNTEWRCLEKVLLDLPVSSGLSHRKRHRWLSRGQRSQLPRESLWLFCLLAWCNSSHTGWLTVCSPAPLLNVWLGSAPSAALLARPTLFLQYPAPLFLTGKKHVSRAPASRVFWSCFCVIGMLTQTGSRMWWQEPVVPSAGRQRQEDPLLARFVKSVRFRDRWARKIRWGITEDDILCWLGFKHM